MSIYLCATSRKRITRKYRRIVSSLILRGSNDCIFRRLLSTKYYLKEALRKKRLFLHHWNINFGKSWKKILCVYIYVPQIDIIQTLYPCISYNAIQNLYPCISDDVILLQYSTNSGVTWKEIYELNLELLAKRWSYHNHYNL